MSCLVLVSGVTNESHLSGPKKSSTVPDYIMHSIGELKVLA